MSLAVSRLLSVSLLSLVPYVALANPGGALTRETKLTANDAASLDEFGFSVAVSGDTAVVGSPGEFREFPVPGAAYVFVRSGGLWILQQKLTATDAAPGDRFGSSVAVSGDTAVVGAPFDSDAGLASGSAYVFVRSGGVWSQQQKLTASDVENGDEFGLSVAVSGNTAVVGTLFGDSSIANSGAAYVFLRSGGVWSPQQKLTASDASPGVAFGFSVGVSGDTAVVGAFQERGIGSAYVFLRTGGVWSQQQKLTASQYAGGNAFGYSVAVNGDTVLLGAPLDLQAGFASGSAYVFVRSGSVWSETQKLTASDTAIGDQFGLFVAVSGDTAMVGAPGGYRAHAAGSAYVFARSGGLWTEQQKLSASDAAEGDLFGISVAVSGNTTVVGAAFDDDGGTNSGSAYVYEPELSALSPAKVWVGMKNSALDLRAEVFLNATKVGQGELNNVSGGGAGFNNALLNTIPLTLTRGVVSAPSGAQLSIKVSARRTCFGKGNSGTATLWYNGRPVDGGASRDAGSRFDATIGGTTSDYYLRSGFGLSTTAGSSRTSADAQLNSSAPCPVRPFASFGTWSSTLP